MTPPDARPDEKSPPGKDTTEYGAAPVIPAGRWGRAADVFQRAIRLGRVEVRGIQPIPVKERTVERTINIFTLWWSMSTNILAITFGLLAPMYNLNLRNSSLVILFITMLTTILPAYLCTLGPKIGMRQMVQARYSFGTHQDKFSATLSQSPVLLNLATLIGFCIMMAVIGGQCLSAVAGGNLSVSVGIVITAILTLGISFCGFSILHQFERYAWISALISIIVAVGCGGKELQKQVVYDSSPTAPNVISYCMIVAGYMIPWACLSSDFTTYLKPDTSSVKIFTYSYLGLGVPTILLMILGSAIGNAIPNVPAWKAGYDETLVGGVLAAMLSSAGGFGKFLVVLLSFSLLGNLAATSYSVTLNLQLLLPILAKVPRYLFSLVFTALVIPLGIRAAADFFVNLENFVGLIGYWSSAFLAVVLVEHFVFRNRDCTAYDPEAWNDASLLPWGVAAISACVLSFGLIVPSMAQVWYTGPIAKTTGDLGFEFAFIVSGLLYVPFRWLEKKHIGR
ncbi:hypothetical protein N0V88_001245 [Collariella sp. IMI 366227]|nr:hypothetical protein N0V88_001245 [Collariella sp. IMI 366227]